ncbi:MAG: ACP S-malonyltransferase [Gammaproteobacteria bacterium]|nr:ACP S-malonyltransferase [Gammaproteobacteria bacterium]
MSLAIVFPGQGSQSVGMLAALAESEPAVRETFREASQALGYDLWKLVQIGPEDKLAQTERTQPVMLTAGVAVWRAWRNMGGSDPLLFAGHSLGEYTALVCAGSLKFADAVRLVAARGRFMQEAVPIGSGAMAAIMGLDDASVERLCAASASAEEIVTCANYNAPGQVVIAGHVAAVDRAISAAGGAGAKRAVRLPVSAPFHCSLMQPAAARLAEALAGVQVTSPRVAVVHNVDARTRSEPDQIRAALVEQAWKPVRWVQCVRNIFDEGVTRVYEFGPGKVLAGLCKRIERGLDSVAVYDADTLTRACDEG